MHVLGRSIWSGGPPVPVRCEASRVAPSLWFPWEGEGTWEGRHHHLKRVLFTLPPHYIHPALTYLHSLTSRFAHSHLRASLASFSSLTSFSFSSLTSLRFALHSSLFILITSPHFVHSHSCFVLVHSQRTYSTSTGLLPFLSDIRIFSEFSRTSLSLASYLLYCALVSSVTAHSCSCIYCTSWSFSFSFTKEKTSWYSIYSYSGARVLAAHISENKQRKNHILLSSP